MPWIADLQASKITVWKGFGGGGGGGGGLLTGRPWPWWSPGRKEGGFVMAALTRTSLTIFSRLASDCQAEREPSLHNSSDLVSFTAGSRVAATRPHC